jgi:hypothetical protein
MNKLIKKSRNIIAMFLIVTTTVAMVRPKKANAFYCNFAVASLVVSSISCTVGVIGLVRGFFEEKTIIINCCGCGCNEQSANTTVTTNTTTEANQKNSETIKNKISRTDLEEEV